MNIISLISNYHGHRCCIYSIENDLNVLHLFQNNVHRRQKFRIIIIREQLYEPNKIVTKIHISRSTFDLNL